MAKRLARGVHLLELGWREPVKSNAYLVDDGTLTLVDAGFPVASHLQREFSEIGITAGDIDRVLVTHYDFDHVGGLSRLSPELDAPVYVGKADLDILTGTAALPILHHKGMLHRGLRAIFRLPDSLTFRPVRDGNQIGSFTAFHTPGHNPGHTVYVHEGRSAALLGDLVWEDNGELTIPTRLDCYDMRELRESIERLTTDAPPFDIACVAHGDPLRNGGSEALQALADRHDSQSPGFLQWTSRLEL